MSSYVITFRTDEWNALLNLAIANPKYPYIHISRDKVIATDGKVALARKLKKDVTGPGKHIFIHKQDMPHLVDRRDANKSPVIKIMIKEGAVKLKYPNGQTKAITYAFNKVDGFPTLKSLKSREANQSDNKITFTVSRRTLEQLLKSTASDTLHITVHENTLVGKWKAGNELGFFAQLQPEEG